MLFVVINTFTKKYLAQFPGLRGALFFVSDIAPHTDDTVFLEPANEKYTPAQVRQGPSSLRSFCFPCALL